MALDAITSTAALRPMSVSEQRSRAESLVEGLTVPSPQYDRVLLSQEAKERMDRERAEALLAQQQEEREARRDAMSDPLADARKSAPTGESMGKCIQIASRIMRGDRVPQADEKFLYENAPELYRQTLMTRSIEDDPDDCESLLDEEDLAASSAATAMAVLRPELERLASTLEEDMAEDSAV